MRNKRQIGIILAVFIMISTITGCQTLKNNGTNLSVGAGRYVTFATTYRKTDNEYMTGAVLWFQRSGEAKALFYQGYNLARMMVDNNLKSPSNEKKAVVLDVDETVLDNSPYAAYNVLSGRSYPTNWNKWVSSARAEVLPGAAEFLKYVDSKGIDIYYISNRRQHELDATIKNLNNKGLPQADKSHMLLMDGNASKENRRSTVDKDHDIILLMGDNLIDFADAFEQKPTDGRLAEVERFKKDFGTKFIVFPNPLYGDWEGALYNYSSNMNPTEANRIRKNALNPFSAK